ncbi:MAG: DUF2092 domain-containing protein [Planctomycetes bacterium]|nr:DUF2092 domain-containing protein [Planctomycetota bacterium]
MKKPNDQRDPLDRLTEAFANLPVPAGPDDEVKQRLLETLARSSDEPVTITLVPFWRRNAMRKFASVAAVVLVVLGIATYLSPTENGGPSSAYAAMIEQLQEIRSMSYTTRIIMLPGQTGMAVRTQVLNQDQIREEILVKTEEQGDPTIFSVLIHDSKLGKVLLLQLTEKTAKIIEMSEQLVGPQQPGFLEKFRKMRPDHAEYLGKEALNGKEVLKYKYKKPDGHYMLWLDPDSQLPVKAVIADVADSKKVNAKFEMTDFVWNPELDESLFSLEIPEGYDLEREEISFSDNMRKAQEGVVTMLGFYVRLNENEFPEEFNVLVFGSVMKKMMPSGATLEELKAHHAQIWAKGLGRPEILGMSDEQREELVREFGKSSAMGGGFLHAMMENGNWHYQGKGIKLGEADKIVAWWYPKKDEAEEGTDVGTAQVLYGDLRIETVPVSELPELDGEK